MKSTRNRVEWILLFFCLFLPSCTHKPKLTGEALQNRISAFLASETKDAPDFTGSPEEVERLIRKTMNLFPAARTGQDTVYLPGTDGKPRALGLHVPLSYTPGRPLPVVLWLHGGVNGSRQNRGAEVAHYFARESDSLYFLFAAVSGEHGATWFDEVGIENIRRALIYLKSHYDIDDNRVLLAGVSDGGTGCYVAGINNPDAYAGFIVCSSSPELLPLMGIPFLPHNMKLRSWHIVHGGKDRLYPGDRIKTIMDQLIQSGIPITFHYYPEMPHGLDYMPKEKPSVLQFIESTRRPPLPRELDFQAIEPIRLSWVSIDSLVPPSPSAPAEAGKLHISCSSDSIVAVSVNIKQLSLLVPRELLDLNRPLTVVWNGKLAFKGKLTSDPDIMLIYAKLLRDRTFLPVARLELTSPESVN